MSRLHGLTMMSGRVVSLERSAALVIVQTIAERFWAEQTHKTWTHRRKESSKRARIYRCCGMLREAHGHRGRALGAVFEFERAFRIWTSSSFHCTYDGIQKFRTFSRLAENSSIHRSLTKLCNATQGRGRGMRNRRSV